MFRKLKYGIIIKEIIALNSLPTFSVNRKNGIPLSKTRKTAFRLTFVGIQITLV